MNVVLPDIDAAGLKAVQEGLETGCAGVSVVADVGRLADVETLADSAYERFGAVHLVFKQCGHHDAGLAAETPAGRHAPHVDTNLWGTLYGMKVFMPRMLADGAGHVVNTSS